MAKKVLIYCTEDYRQRMKILAKELRAAGCEVDWTENSEDTCDVLVVASEQPMYDFISRVSKKTKVVTYDCGQVDVLISDITVSPYLNPQSFFYGWDYTLVPRTPLNYKVDKNKDIYLDAGPIDSLGLAERTLEICTAIDCNVLIKKSRNHRTFNNLRYTFVEPKDEYAAMSECGVAVIADEQTLFRALYFGIPTVYVSEAAENLKKNWKDMESSCIITNRRDFGGHLVSLCRNQYVRLTASISAKNLIDGMGADRIVHLILNGTGTKI